MLEKIRENSRSLLVWVLFGIIIAFFIISFGPQASESQFSCGGASDSFVVKVGDEAVGMESWRYAMQSMGLPTGTNENARKQRAREFALDLLVERELLAQGAEDLGVVISDDEITRSLYDLDKREGRVFAMGRRAYADHVGEDGSFDYETLERMASSLGLSGVPALQKQQERELLAIAMRDYIVATSRTSLDEARGRYDAENRTAAVEFVKFDLGRYKRGLDLTDERLEAWLADNADKAKERYESDKETLYTGVPRQVFARAIFVEREKPAAPVGGDDAQGDDAPGDDAAAGDDAAGDDAAADPGKAVASAARARVEAGEDFATVARELSQDANKNKGGALGWRSLSSLGLGPEVSGAVEDLEVGAVSEVVETPRGFYLVRFDDAREGDLTFDQVKLEIARKLATDDIARDTARADAKAAVAQLQAGGTLASLFGARPSEAPAATDGATGDDGEATGPRYVFPVDLPRPAGIEAPALQTARRVTRQGTIVAGANLRPFVGKSPALVKAVFDTQEVGAKPSEFVETDDGFVLVKVTERTEPDFEKFDETRNETLQQASQVKGADNVQDWLAGRCAEAAAAGEIAYDPERVTYFDENDKPITVDYTPCQTMNQFAMMQRLQQSMGRP